MTEANSLVVCTSRRTNAPKSSPALGSRHWSRNASSYLIKRHEALAIIENLGPIVYAVTYGPYIKIGWTAHITRRIQGLDSQATREGHPPCTIIAFRFGTTDDETEAHHALREHLAKGREYFHPNPPVIELLESWQH